VLVQSPMGRCRCENANLWDVQASLARGTIACGALGDEGADGRALERELETSPSPEGCFSVPVRSGPELSIATGRLGTAHDRLIDEIMAALWAGNKPAEPAGRGRLREPISHAETRGAALHCPLSSTRGDRR